MKRKNVCLDIVNLDSKNPRFAGRINKDDNVANFMIKRLSSSHIKEMLESVVNDGLSPADVICVFLDNGKYITLDGNRRVLALKMIYDNEELNLSEKIKIFLNKNKNKIEEKKNALFNNLEITILKSREVANKWINLKHTGDFGGASAQEWGTLEKKINNNVPLALFIEKEALGAGILPDDYAEKISFSVWDRFFSTDFSKEWLGVKGHRKKEIIVINRAKLQERMRIMVEATKDKVLNYPLVMTNEKKLKVIEMMNEKYLSNSKFEKKINVKARIKIKIEKIKKQREVLISNKAKNHIKNRKILNLINQVEKISIKNNNELLACVIRPMVEISIDTFLGEKMKWTNKKFDNTILANRIVKTIEGLKDVHRRNKAVIKDIKNNVDKYLHVWNADLHDVNFSSSVKDIKDSFANISILLEEIWKNID